MVEALNLTTSASMISLKIHNLENLLKINKRFIDGNGPFVNKRLVNITCQ